MSITNGFIKINGITLPYPSRGLRQLREQLVDGTRNAKGETVAQKVNRRINKFDGLEWAHLTASEWRIIQQQVDKFEGVLEFWDNPSGTFKTIKVYWGNEESEPYKIKSGTGEVLEYVNCVCNIIDMGY